MLHLAAAWEIAVELKMEGAEDEAALFGAAASGAETRMVPCEIVPVRRLCAFACVCVRLRAYPGRTDGVARVVARVVATIYPNKYISKSV